MAGMFFTMQEVVEKLSKTEEQVHDLIQEGKLREFRDGTKLLFKVSEVESLGAQLPRANDREPVEIFPNEGEVVLEPVAEPSAPAVPSSSVPDLDISEDSPIEIVALDDDDLLLSDISLDDSQGGLFVESELPVDALSLEDSVNFLAGDDDSDGTVELADGGLDSEDVLFAADDEPLDSLAVEDITEEPAVELTADDADSDAGFDLDDDFDIVVEDDATEDLSIEPETASEDSSAFITSDESSGDFVLEDGDSLKLAETSVAREEKTEESFDLGDSFDMLISDDTTSGMAAESAGGLLSEDTLGGLVPTGDLAEDASDDELLSSLTKADTAMGNTGINILAESDGDYQLASDTKADTVIPDDEDDLSDLDDLDMSDGDFLSESAGLGNLDDDDLNLDSIGSGSGLLDLSLQADDTSLGAVLDDILPSEDEVETSPVELDDGIMDDEADNLFEETAPQQMMAASASNGQMAVRYEAPPTAVENACGIAMFLPAIMIAYSAIILLFGLKGITPKLLTQVSAEVGGFPLIWWIVIGVSVLFLLILVIAAAMGGGSGQKKEKKAKVSKPKKAKVNKPKKAKKVKAPKKAKKKK